VESKTKDQVKKNIIVTGASKGIGRAIADIYAASGHNLFLCSRGKAALNNTVEELNSRYPFAVVKAKTTDLAKKEEAISFGKWCLEGGDPDILINNAGMFEPGSIFNEPDGVLESQLASNLFSAYHLTRTVLPAMMKNRNGHIFNMCSIAALLAYKNGGAFSVSKYAMYGFSKNLREEMKPYDIKVTAVHPGAVMTDSWVNFDNSSGRIMIPGDIAQLVYAASMLSFQACVEDIVIRPVAGDL
jgi:short-subunit dehydrogenase